MTTKHLSFSFLSLAFLLCYSEICFGYLPTTATHWSPAGATWYGSPDGAGSDGGACGYGNAVSKAPFSSMITAAGPSLYNSGKQCGACYMVKCTEHPSCSGVPVRVVITDSCPGGPCASESAHFDLSGTAFGAMAKTGEGKKLRDVGVLNIRYSRVSCDYSEQTIAFHVDLGSNPNYFSVLVEFEEGDGDLAAVYLKEGKKWRAMQRSWGAVWKLDAGSELQPPFSIRLTSQYSGRNIVAINVIPDGWKPGATYRSLTKEFLGPIMCVVGGFVKIPVGCFIRENVTRYVGEREMVAREEMKAGDEAIENHYTKKAFLEQLKNVPP